MNIFEHLQIQINNLREITEIIEGMEDRPNVSDTLRLNTRSLERIDEVNTEFEYIKSNLDTTYKFVMPTGIQEIRKLVVKLIEATQNLHTNICNLNDQLVQYYNNEIINILNECR